MCGYHFLLVNGVIIAEHNWCEIAALLRKSCCISLSPALLLLLLSTMSSNDGDSKYINVYILNLYQQYRRFDKSFISIQTEKINVNAYN
jgi:hypothetical protein